MDATEKTRDIYRRRAKAAELRLLAAQARKRAAALRAQAVARRAQLVKEREVAAERLRIARQVRLEIRPTSTGTTAIEASPDSAAAAVEAPINDVRADSS